MALAAVVWAEAPKASQLYKEGQRAERSGDVVRAYLLYSEAAALDPSHPEYWLRSQALRTRASLKAKPLPPSATVKTPSSGGQPETEPLPPGFSTSISEEDLAEVRRLKPPPELKAEPGSKNLDLRGDAKSVFVQATRAFGLGTVFDQDYEPGPQLHIRLDDVDYRQALHSIEAATGSFVFPIGQRLVMVVKDTPQKRAEREPAIAVTVPVPQTVTPQEAQEVGRAVQQAMEIQRLSVDGNRRMVLIKDRISKVRPAQVLFEQLAIPRPQIEVEMEFLEVDRSALLSYGFRFPTQFPLVFFGQGGSITGNMQSLAKLFGGHLSVAIGIANSAVFANMTDSQSKTLLRAQVRALDGQPSSFHVGDKYPVISAGFLGQTMPGFAPSFNFEDLGLVLKLTPHIHGTEEVSLDVEAEFKVLTGKSINGVPLIATRKLQSKVRLQDQQWAVVAGLMSNSEARQITGMPLLVRLPFLRENNVNRTSTEVVVLLKPVLQSIPPEEYVTRALWIGSEARLDIPL